MTNTLSTVSKSLSLQNKGADAEIQGYGVDSRTLREGALFFAIKGETHDGHDFLKDIETKAIAAVVHESCSYSGPLTLLKVKDPLTALKELALQKVAKANPTILGITGSVGKTTTKEFCKALFEQKHKVFATPKNQNSQVGLPLALLNDFVGDEKVCVLEMGMSHKGEIAELTKVAPPKIAIITAVTYAHAAFFKSLDQIAEAKAEIASHPSTETVILHKELLRYPAFRALTCKSLYTYSIDDDSADFFLEQDGDSFLIKTPSKRGVISSKLPFSGRHNLENFLAALASGRVLGLTFDEMQKGFSRCLLPPMRMQLVERGGIIFINDAYNASPASFKAAFESMPKPQEGGRRVAVIGEMKELGEFSWQCHTDVAMQAIDCIDAMYCFGKECAPMVETFEKHGKEASFFETKEKLTLRLKTDLKKGDVVLLKGANSTKMWTVQEDFI